MITGKAIKKPIPVEFMLLESNNMFQAYIFIYGYPPVPHVGLNTATDRWEEWEVICLKQGFMPLKTLESGEGTQNANFGDYILKGIDGECWPIKADIFERTYDII